MKFYLFILSFSFSNFIFCQGDPVDQVTQQLESLAEKTEEPIEDDSWLQQLEVFKKHPLNVNSAKEEELKQLGILSPLQIKNLLHYRSLLGNLIHINELQAVPEWDPELIRKLLPYITIENNLLPLEKLTARFRKGDYSFLARASQSLIGKSENNNSAGNALLGSPQHILLRFQYRYGNQLQYGITAEKDAGEPLLGKMGFDFYSFHFFARRIGVIKRLAIGDFTVNMGQGLVQWQGMGNRKSGNVLMVKQQEEMIKPYHSAGEIYFHRGVAISLERGKWELTAFGSTRKLSGNVQHDSTNVEFLSSFSSTGYHRTVGELANKNVINQLSAGGNISYTSSSFHVGWNLVGHNFSVPIKKDNEPYQLYAIRGKSLLNSSIEYECTHQNLHVFGEFAIDRHFNKAWLNGLLLSLDRRLDLSIVFRSISSAYQSFNAAAFTENTLPVNETGVYCGLSFKISSHLRVDGFADLYSFPWLKYRVDAPSQGNDFFIQLNFEPGKRVQVQSRFKIESKEGNAPGTIDPTKKLIILGRQGWRVQVNWQATNEVSLAQRLELCRYVSNKAEDGIMSFIDLNFHPLRKPYQITGRLQFFETGSYDSRIYALERDVLYAYSIPAFFGKGWGFYLMWHYAMRKGRKGIFRIIPDEYWFKWGQTNSLPAELVFNSIEQKRPPMRYSITIQSLYSF